MRPSGSRSRPPKEPSRPLEWGTNILTAEAWQVLWEESGLQDREVRTYQIDARTEVKSRIRWIGWLWILKAWYRVLSLYLKNPAARQFIKEQLDTSREMFGYLGYELFVGRKSKAGEVGSQENVPGPRAKIKATEHGDGAEQIGLAHHEIRRREG